MEIIGYILSVVIGITLGLIGGGGSILTVPILVYLFAVPAAEATSYSLFIVGLTAAVGAFRHFRLGNLNLKTAFSFAIPSLVSLLLIRQFLLPNIPQQLFLMGTVLVTKDVLIMVVFAFLMIAASISMIKNNKSAVDEVNPSTSRLVIIGLFVGVITGFLGAGGGFLIIPALLFFAGLSMKKAVGTSLLIIAINSLLGFIGDATAENFSIDYSFLFIISGLAVAGMFIGTKLSTKIDGAKLKPAFGWFVLIMGAYIIAKELLIS